MAAQARAAPRGMNPPFIGFKCISCRRSLRNGPVDFNAASMSSLDLRAEALESPSILGGRQSDHALERAPKAQGVFVTRCNGNLFHTAGCHRQLVAAGDDGRHQAALRLHPSVFGNRLHRRPEEDRRADVGDARLRAWPLHDKHGLDQRGSSGLHPVVSENMHAPGCARCLVETYSWNSAPALGVAVLFHVPARKRHPESRAFSRG
jgi:hypothetical protein